MKEKRHPAPGRPVQGGRGSRARRRHSIKFVPIEMSGEALFCSSNTADRPNYEPHSMSMEIARLMAEANLLRSRHKVSEAVQLFQRVLELDERHADALNCKGVCLKQLGDLAGALQAYQQVLELDPQNWQAYNNLGVLYKEQNQVHEAVTSYHAAIMHGPADCIARANMATLLTELGSHFKEIGELGRALSHYREAVSLNPQYAPALFSLGVFYSELHRFDEALHFYQLALQHNPQYVEALCNCGVIYKNRGNLEAAIQHYDMALSINPNFDVANNNMAMAYTDLGTKVKGNGRVADSIAYYKKALLYNAKYAHAWYNLGVAYSERNDPDEAIIAYNVALQLDPKSAEALNNLGVLYKDRGNLERSIQYYTAALVANPTFAQTLNNLGVIYTILGKLDEAHLYCDRAIESNPNYSEAYNNIGVLYRDEGRIAEAIQCYERCLELDPTSKNAAQNRLLALNYSDDVTVDFVSRAHREWGERYIRAIQGPQPAPRKWSNALTAQRVLRVGLLSPDFFIHSVSYFVEALLEHADRTRVYLVCYSNVAREDTKTTRLRSLADQWRHITGTSAQAICDLVREDGIDILIELTGHTAGNRLDVMAMRAAPVQVTYIGYPNTTGLSGAIDYRISDAVADPIDSTQTYTETLVRLPRCFLCYTPPQGVSEVSAAPATVSNFVTFGSFNNLAKLNDRVLSRWAEIMHRVPQSRLLIKCKPFASDSVRAKMMAALEARGVSSSRVDLLPLLPNTVDHLRAYSLIDIALDSFPYSGTTTTCEALFMGVPVVTLRGPSHAHNVSVSLLKAIGGLDQLIAQTDQQYVDIAVRTAQDIAALALLRQSLRARMLQSSLCDGPNFVAAFQSALASMWSNHVNMNV